MDYSIIDEIYLENEDKLRECKLAQVMLQVEIKNSETMLRQEEEKKDLTEVSFIRLMSMCSIVRQIGCERSSLLKKKNLPHWN